MRTQIIFAAIILMQTCATGMAKLEAKADFVIKGRVTDAKSGKPIAGAKVGDVNEYADGKFFAITDANGNYSYKTYYEEHNIKCSAEGYKNKNQTLLTRIFGREKEKIIDFKLERS